jgi:hypothetical protein
LELHSPVSVQESLLGIKAAGRKLKMNNSIYATFADPKMAEKAVGAVLDHGVKTQDISIVFPEGYVSTINNDKDQPTAENLEKTAEHGITTTTAGDAASGAAKGAGIGLAAGVLAALAAVFIPGIGLVAGGGALAIAIGGAAGTTAAGAVAGGITGYLKDQGVSDEAVQSYTNAINSGGALVSITLTDEKVNSFEVEAVLEKYQGALSSVAPRARLL